MEWVSRFLRLAEEAGSIAKTRGNLLSGRNHRVIKGSYRCFAGEPLLYDLRNFRFKASARQTQQAPVPINKTRVLFVVAGPIRPDGSLRCAACDDSRERALFRWLKLRRERRTG